MIGAVLSTVSKKSKDGSSICRKLIAAVSFTAIASVSIRAADAKDIEPFLKTCETSIAKEWQTHSLDQFQIPSYFRQHAKGVVCFELSAKGQAKKISVKHSSSESLIVAARLKYADRADGLMKAMDDAMIASVKESSPFPVPPKELVAHKRYAVVFDTARLKPLRIFIDDQIPVAQSNPFVW